MLKGSCLCGAVTFTAKGARKSGAICHCRQCRKQSGHVWASTVAPEQGVEISGEVRWFAASPSARRGFCPTCGAFLFWKAHDEDTMSFSLGSLEAPTGISIGKHIFVSGKGDYYEITDDIPQKP